MEEWDVTLEDLRGSREVERRYRERLQPTADHVAAGAAVIGLLAGAFAEVGVLTLGIGFGLIALLTYRFRDRITERLDVGPAVDVIEHTIPGLTDKEVQEFFTLHQEYLKIKEEKREEMEREAQRNANQGQTLNKQ